MTTTPPNATPTAKPLDIPVAATHLLLVTTSGTECSLFVNGARINPPNRDNSIQMTRIVREICDLANVTVIDGVDRRVLVDSEEGVWRQRIEAVILRQADLTKVDELRAQADANLREADRIERRA